MLTISKRGHTLPEATTESAREARKSFFCTRPLYTGFEMPNLISSTGELCQKGYARMNDFEAHEGSYDHQHRKVS